MSRRSGIMFHDPEGNRVNALSNAEAHLVMGVSPFRFGESDSDDEWLGEGRTGSQGSTVGGTAPEQLSLHRPTPLKAQRKRPATPGDSAQRLQEKEVIAEYSVRHLVGGMSVGNLAGRLAQIFRRENDDVHADEVEPTLVRGNVRRAVVVRRSPLQKPGQFVTLEKALEAARTGLAAAPPAELSPEHRIEASLMHEFASPVLSPHRLILVCGGGGGGAAIGEAARLPFSVGRFSLPQPIAPEHYAPPSSSALQADRDAASSVAELLVPELGDNRCVTLTFDGRSNQKYYPICSSKTCSKVMPYPPSKTSDPAPFCSKS